MEKRFRKLIVGIIISAFLSGCIPLQNIGNTDSGLQDTERTNSEDATKTKQQGTLAGAGVGAAVGGLLGQALGHNTKATLIGAGLGAALGSLAGYKLAENLAERKKQYKTTEQGLDGERTYWNGKNQELREENHKTSEQIIALNERLKSVKSRKVSAALTAHEKAAYLEEIQQNKNHKIALNNELTALNEYKENLVKAGGDQFKAQQLENEIVALRENISMLDSNNRQMAKIVNALPTRG